MKKFLALAALVLGLASCQNEPEGLNIVTGGEVDTVVTVTLPEATRASSADSGLVNVDPTAYDLRYILEVYDAAGDVFVYRAVETKATNATDARTVTFPVRLIPERSYNFVVWADFVYKNGSADLYYNTLNNTTYGLNAVTIADGKWVAMDEARDAYTAVKYVDSYNSGKSINLTLIRPFGKLRVITTDIAALDALAVNARPTAVKVTYKNGVYTGFNALTETGLNAGANAEFNNTLSADQYEENDDENMVLFTDYIFGTTTGTIQFDMEVTYANDNKSTNSFNTEIPVQRNYLTTISGNILTDGNDIRVDITDGFENEQNPNNPPYYQETISSAAEFYAAVKPANAGKKYIVISALNLTSETISTLAATRAVEAATTTTIDLNGYTITVDNKNENGDALIALDGQTIVFTDSSADGDGKVVLAENSKPLFDATDATDATVVVEGGSVADGAVVGNFFVNDGENADSSLKLLQHICENGGEFTFSQDLAGDVTVYQKEGKNVVINGNGKQFNGTIYVYGNSRNDGAETVTIKNVNFISNDTRDFISSNSTDNDKRYAHNVTIEGCTFTGAKGVDVVGVRFRQAYNITIKKCDANDVHSLVQLSGCHNLLIENTDIKFVGDAGINLLSSINGANIVNCTIKATEEKGIGIRVDAVNGPMNVTNCKIEAYQPIVFRNSQNAFIVNLKDNTLVKGDSYDIYVASGECPTINVFDSNELVIGSDKDYYIANEASMRWLANAVNGGNTFAGKTVKLIADIDLNGKEWTPIGNSSKIFKGTFDGQNHTIKNLVVNGNGKSDQGLFGNTHNGEIKNLVVENAEVSGRLNVGVVAGTPYTSKYTNITVKGHVEVNGMAYVGAVGGKNAYA
ncbi:MAG: right-handed parallel beta-helix repeat-containing protein, partial [Alistipes sp.]|nr:right-handed parallel beta-helix repeat-containing protein [Alistipes sp.]